MGRRDVPPEVTARPPGEAAGGVVTPPSPFMRTPGALCVCEPTGPARGMSSSGAVVTRCPLPYFAARLSVL